MNGTSRAGNTSDPKVREELEDKVRKANDDSAKDIRRK